MVSLKDTLRWFRDRTVPTWHKLIGLLAVAYTISPIDAIPDIIPVLGWLDDIGVIGLVAAFYLRQIAGHSARTIEVQAQPATPRLPAATR